LVFIQGSVLARTGGFGAADGMGGKAQYLVVVCAVNPICCVLFSMAATWPQPPSRAFARVVKNLSGTDFNDRRSARSAPGRIARC